LRSTIERGVLCSTNIEEVYTRFNRLREAGRLIFPSDSETIYICVVGDTGANIVKILLQLKRILCTTHKVKIRNKSGEKDENKEGIQIFTL
jgi:hypothetical protein